jgi:hypothetical protein
MPRERKLRADECAKATRGEKALRDPVTNDRSGQSRALTNNRVLTQLLKLGLDNVYLDWATAPVAAWIAVLRFSVKPSGGKPLMR